MTTRLVTSQDVTLWSEDFGKTSDPALLLIAGGNLSSQSWPNEFIDLLVAAGLHVIRYDHRDTGRSTTRSFEDYPYGFDELTADAIAVLDEWDVQATHVVGMSLGHTIGQLLALDYPDRLLSLTVMLGGALDIDFDANVELAINGLPPEDDLPLPTQRFVDLMMLAPMPAESEEAALAQRVEKWSLLNGDELPFDPEEFRQREIQALEHAGTHHETVVHHMIPQPPVTRGAELGHVTTPTLAIQAMCDPVAPPPHARHLAELIPEARIAEIPRMGHALAAAVHQPLAEAILQHITHASTRAAGAAPAHEEQ